jgi:hypothetical protein
VALGVFNQIGWTGVGDADECWIIATFWPLVASGVMTRDQLPTIAEFRAAAGRPDRPGPSGGNNKNLIKALKVLAPGAEAKLFVGGLAAFTKQLRSGWIASLSLDSGLLPSYLRFGFQDSHQVSVIFQNGKFYVMNPLAKEGSALLPISAADLSRAAGGLLGDGLYHAVLIRAGKQDSQPKPVKPRRVDPVRRDLNPPIDYNNFIDPYEVVSFYNARHPKNKPMA